MSVIMHALAFAGLLYLTPVREIVQELRRPSRPEQNMSAAELARLADAIELHAADQIEANTGELGRVLDKLGEIQDGIAKRFITFEQRRRTNAARDALDEMQKAADQMREAVGAIEQDVAPETTDRFQALAERAQERASNKLDMVGFNVVTVVAGHRATQDAHQQAKALHDQHTTQKARVLQLERNLTTQQARAEQQQQQIQKLKDAGRNEKQLEPYVKRLQDQQTTVEEATRQFEEGRSEQVRLLAAAEESQELALKAQEEVAEALRELVEAKSSEPQADVAVAGLALASRLSAPRARSANRRLDVADLYAHARALEDSIAETFKEVRAMDLAMVRDMSLEDARGDIDLIRPVRPDLDVDLLREATRTEARFEEHKGEVRTALRETSSMVNLSHRMLEMASESVDKMRFGTDVQMAPEEEEAPDFRLIIRELAMEDVTGRFSDLAEAMQALEQQGDEGAGGARRRSGGSGGADGGGAAGRRGLDYQDLTAEEIAGMGSLPLFGDDGAGESGLLPDLPPDVPAVGARKLSPDGRPGPWMFLDTWYTLGPFPNPNRVNIDREFPPDSLVDLDASYVGKDGRSVRWQFVQSGSPMIAPANAEPYGIWYAYTEFYCDRPRDVLIALGTDDRGNLKINGVPVWISSKQLKGWEIDEVWRRVHFSEGINRILYRIENGWQVTGFSLVLRLDEP